MKTSGDRKATNNILSSITSIYMNTTETLQQLQILKLHGMATAYKTQMELPLHQQLESHELLAQLVQSEIHNRSNERTSNYLKLAKFRISSTTEQIECSS